MTSGCESFIPFIGPCPSVMLLSHSRGRLLESGDKSQASTLSCPSLISSALSSQITPKLSSLSPFRNRLIFFLPPTSPPLCYFFPIIQRHEAQFASFRIYCTTQAEGRIGGSRAGQWEAGVGRLVPHTSLSIRSWFLKVHKAAEEVHKIVSGFLDQGCQLLMGLFKVSPREGKPRG